MDPDPDPSIFITDLQDANKNKFLKKGFPVYYFFKVPGYLYIIFKDKKSKKMSQNSRNQGFSYYICLMIDRRIRIRIQEAQKHVDPDPDPEHCFLEFVRQYSRICRLRKF
jgi:hypothetical protein